MKTKTKTTYCSACDREVLITVPADADESTLEGAVCMDIGDRCTGTLCPICAVPPDEMRKQAQKPR